LKEAMRCSLNLLAKLTSTHLESRRELEHLREIINLNENFHPNDGGNLQQMLSQQARENLDRKDKLIGDLSGQVEIQAILIEELMRGYQQKERGPIILVRSELLDLVLKSALQDKSNPDQLQTLKSALIYSPLLDGQVCRHTLESELLRGLHQRSHILDQFKAQLITQERDIDRLQ
jgi:hypothetical protein